MCTPPPVPTSAVHWCCVHRAGGHSSTKYWLRGGRGHGGQGSCMQQKMDTYTNMQAFYCKFGTVTFVCYC